MLKGRKHFSQSVRPMVSVAVSKLGKTKLVFVQLGAKINSVYYCSNKVNCRQFAVSRTRTSCSSRTERHARHSRHCRLPAFNFQCAWVHWTRKLAAEQSRSKSRRLFSVDSVVAHRVTSQNFRHWSAEASSDRLLGSAKPGLTEPTDWSAAKKTDDGYQGILSLCGLTMSICVRDSPCFTVFRMKI